MWKDIFAVITALLTFKEVKKAMASTSTVDNDPNKIYKEAGARYNVDWRLLKAIAQVESSENANAVNPSDPSYGLMQVLCTGGEVCQNRFPAVNGWQGMTKTKLLDPEVNIDIATQILKWNIDNYGQDGLDRAIAVYNNWSARNQQRPFSNQSYVNKVLDKYNIIKAEYN